ncbi:MAG TPA: hypothetical protein VKB95_02225 [Chitinophagaceae bacterium]|nr:hypothetical protein [Chitinophagaceae bacterium]
MITMGVCRDLLLALIAVYSFSSGQSKYQLKEELIVANSVEKAIDTLKKIIPDDYPVTNDMFKGNYEDKISSDVYSGDKAWFSNDTIKQTLVFELYTDYHRLLIFHFLNNDIPEELIQRMELYKNGEFADQKSKTNSIKGFIDSSKRISQKYFKSFHGIKLGDKKDHVIRLYGKPHTIKTKSKYEIYSWEFIGDIGDPKTIIKTNKSLAQDSFGYQVIAFFKKDKLFAIMLHNDIP